MKRRKRAVVAAAVVAVDLAAAECFVVEEYRKGLRRYLEDCSRIEMVLLLCHHQKLSPDH